MRKSCCTGTTVACCAADLTTTLELYETFPANGSCLTRQAEASRPAVTLTIVCACKCPNNLPYWAKIDSTCGAEDVLVKQLSYGRIIVSTTNAWNRCGCGFHPAHPLAFAAHDLELEFRRSCYGSNLSVTSLLYRRCCAHIEAGLLL